MEVPEELQSRIRMYANWAQQMVQDYGNTMSEKETETRLVEPVLEILQWDPKSIDVRKGYPIKTDGSTYEADYALMIGSKPRVLIEVKKAADSLSDENVIQLMRYASYEKADISILTNGDKWRIYESSRLQDMVFNFNLGNMENNIDCLWLLSKESIEIGLLDQEIDRRYAIGEIYEYIEKNRRHWISDIEAVSEKSTKENVSRILDEIIIEKDLVLKKLSAQGKRLFIDGGSPEAKLASTTEDHTGKSTSSFRFRGSLKFRGSLELSSDEISSLSEEPDAISSLLETTLQQKQPSEEFMVRVSHAAQERLEEQISIEKMQRIIGTLATDEDFRNSFFHDIVAACHSAGLNLTQKEIAALRSLKEDAVKEFANSLDERITKFFPSSLP